VDNVAIYLEEVEIPMGIGGAETRRNSGLQLSPR
jgi:hypothetical protein